MPASAGTITVRPAISVISRTAELSGWSGEASGPDAPHPAARTSSSASSAAASCFPCSMFRCPPLYAGSPIPAAPAPDWYAGGCREPAGCSDGSWSARWYNPAGPAFFHPGYTRPPRSWPRFPRWSAP